MFALRGDGAPEQSAPYVTADAGRPPYPGAGPSPAKTDLRTRAPAPERLG
jgi:hypothetical protein